MCGVALDAICPHSHRSCEHVQPMCPNIATPLAVACRGPRRHRSSTPGCSSWTPSPAQPFRRQNPSSRGRRTEGACLGAAGLHSGHLRSPGLEPGTRKDPDPRRRSSRGSGPQNRPARPATVATRRMRPVPSTTSWRYGLSRTCRLVTTTTFIHMARPGPVSAPRGHPPL
jgi:hypothetical protein